MNLAAACGWSLGRSVVTALVAVPICIWLARRLTLLNGLARRAAWVLLLLPFLFPTLLSGYSYAGASLRLIGLPIWETFPSDQAHRVRQWLSAHYASLDEGLLIVLLLTKAVPAGTMVLAFAPRPPYSPAAWHCRKIAVRHRISVASRCAAYVEYVRYGPLRPVMAGAGLIFLVCFQEFELPSLLGRPAWTVWLFDAQVGGLALSESLRATLLPVLCQFVVIIPLWRGLVRYGGEPAALQDTRGTGGPAAFRDASYLIAAVIVACVVPLSLVGGGTWQGLRALVANRFQLEQLAQAALAGTFFATLSAALAMFAAEWRPRRPGVGRWLAILAVPGLFGPLVLGLGLVEVFHWPVLNAAYRTPVSLVVALVLFLLPRAMLLQAVLQAMRPHEARHAAALLDEAADGRRRAAAGDLAWHLGHRARFWSVALLSSWGFLELTLAYLLGPDRLYVFGPVTIVSVPVLLYNQMHFGKNPILSAMTCLAVIVPVILFLGGAALRPLISRLFRR